MKIAHKQNGYYTLNFEKGEDVVTTLATFIKKEGIKAGHISGVGAASELELAYYNIETKEYERKIFEEDVEILHLNGNIAVKEDDELVIHIHGTFGRRDFSVFGGHVYKMVISGAGEIHLITFSGQITRTYDDETGLTLMDKEDTLK